MARQTLTQQNLEQAAELARQAAMLTELRETLAVKAEVVQNLQQTCTQLRGEVAMVKGLQEELDKTKKDLEQSKSMQTYYSAEAAKANAELTQAHAVLDGVIGAPTRIYRAEGSSYDTDRSVVTRLAGAFLAIAQKGGVQ